MKGRDLLDYSGPTLRPLLETLRLTRARVTPLLGATANVCFRLDEEAGGRAWLLRGCRRDTRPERLRFTLRFQRALFELGLPVPRTHPAGGAPELYVVGGQCWQVSEFVEGVTYDYEEPAHVAEAGRWLGRLHALSRDIRAAGYCPADHSPGGWLLSPGDLLEASSEAARPHMASRAEVERAWRCFADAARAVRRELTPEIYRSLPEVWAHGDFHGGNLIYRGKGLAALLDFDGVDRRPRVYDVAFALLMLARRGRGSYALRRDWFARFLAAYESETAPLSAAERGLLPAMMALSQLPDRNHLSTLGRYGGDVRRAVGSAVDALEALRDQGPSLRRWCAEDGSQAKGAGRVAAYVPSKLAV